MNRIIDFHLTNDEYIEGFYLLQRENKNRASNNSFLPVFIFFSPLSLLIVSLSRSGSIVYSSFVIIICIVSIAYFVSINTNGRMKVFRYFDAIIKDKSELYIKLHISHETIGYETQFKKEIIAKDSVIEIIQFTRFIIITFKKYEIIIIPVRIFKNDGEINDFLQIIIDQRNIPIVRK